MRVRAGPPEPPSRPSCMWCVPRRSDRRPPAHRSRAPPCPPLPACWIRPDTIWLHGLATHRHGVGAIRAAAPSFGQIACSAGSPRLPHGYRRCGARPTSKTRPTRSDLSTGGSNRCLAFDHQPLGSVVGVLLVKVGLVQLEAGNVQRVGERNVARLPCGVCCRAESFYQVRQLGQISRLRCPHALTLPARLCRRCHSRRAV
jgi:hypothetical protein